MIYAVLYAGLLWFVCVGKVANRPVKELNLLQNDSGTEGLPEEILQLESEILFESLLASGDLLKNHDPVAWRMFGPLLEYFVDKMVDNGLATSHVEVNYRLLK